MPAHYTLPARDIPLEADWDVVVAGGGPAGVAAAAAAASEGAKTLLVEAAGALGGMGTLGLVPAWCPFSDKEKIIYCGLAERVFRAAGANMPHVKPDRLDWVPIDSETLKRVLDDLLEETGARVRFHTQLCAVDTDGGRVATVVVANKAGLTALRAKTFVDATGDADLAAWAGAPFHKGDEETGDMQSATPCFVVSGVNDYAYTHGPNMHPHHADSPIHTFFPSAKYPLLIDKHFCNQKLGSGTVGFNAGHVPGVDATDPDSLSEGLRRGRRTAHQLHEALKEMLPAAYAASFLAATGGLLGIRETRRIVGDYTLTIEDYRARRSFPDDIGRNAYYIDVHNKPGQEGRFKPMRYEKGESHGIPYRCLVPQGIANVLVAGRSISTDRPVQGSTRVMPVCLVMGEAAGVAAAMAAADDGATRAVDVGALRNRLRERGAYIP